jgi:hypothetical protein
MTDIWIDVDTAITVPVNVMPLIDDTDFKTREIAIAYNQAGMDLVWNFQTTAGVTSQTAVTPTTAGVYDWTHSGDAMYKIEIPASGGVSINNDTEGFGWFSGICTGVLAWRGPIIGFRAAALNNALIDGGDTLDVNVTTIVDTAQTANDNGADINAVKVKTDFLPSVTAGGTGGLFIAGTNAATTVTTSFTTTFTGNLTGSVDSVTNAVGSVTGAVGSVTGSVGSVTGAVGSVTSGVTVTTNNDKTGYALTQVFPSNFADMKISLTTGLVDVGTNNDKTGYTVSGTIQTLDALDTAQDTQHSTTQTHLTDIKGATFSGATDSIEAIRDRGDAAWTTGAGGTPPQLLQSTTIATLATQTSFTLTAGSADDDAYNGGVAIITDSVTATQKAVGSISDYTGGTLTVTLSADPGIFTMAAGDTIDILAAISNAPTAAAIVDEWEAQSQADPTGFHVNVQEIGGTAQTANDNGADINTLLTRIVGTLATGTHNPATAAQVAALSDLLDGGRIDLLIDAIKLVTDAQTAISPADFITLIYDRSLASHQSALSAGRAITLGGVPIAETTCTGTPTTSSIQLVVGSAVDNFYNDNPFKILSGAGVGQSRPISGYTGATKTCTFDEPFTVAPSSGDAVAIEIAHVHPVTEIQSGLATEAKQDATDIVIAELTTQGDTNESKLDAAALISTEARLSELDEATAGKMANQVDVIQADTTTDIPALIATAQAAIDGVQTDLSNGTDGLGALKILIDTLNTVADAVKAKTDQMVYTKANELNVNTRSINNAEVIGDGNATPWDGV